MHDYDPDISERLQFSERLKVTLLAKKIAVKPAAFARVFNLRAGELAVTAHAARKWLVGESIPTQERILVLAKWLNVHTAWLRYGEGEATSALNRPGQEMLSAREMALIHSVIGLSQPSQMVVQRLVESLQELERTIAAPRNRARE